MHIEMFWKMAADVLIDTVNLLAELKIRVLLKGITLEAFKERINPHPRPLSQAW
jgi:hypothetical protein